MTTEARILLTAVDQTRTGIASVQANLSSLAASAQATVARLGGLTSLLGAGVFTAFARNAIDTAAALDDMSESTGASVEQLDRLRQVARVSGVEMGTVEAALLRLNKALSQTDDESEGAGKAFEAIGLSFDRMRSLKPDEALRTLAARLAEYEDGAGKTAVGQAILGRQWREYAPLLKDLADAGGEQARITAEQAAAAEQLGKDFARLRGEAADLATLGILKVISALRELKAQFDTFGIAETARQIVNPNRLSALGIGREIADLRARQHAHGISDADYAQLEREITGLQVALANLNRTQADAAQQSGAAKKSLDGFAAAADGADKKTRGAARAVDELSKRLKALETERARRVLEQLEAEGEEAQRIWLEAEEARRIAAETAGRERMESLVAERHLEQMNAEGEEAQREWIEQENRRRIDERIKAEADAARRMADDYQRTADSISDSLTDALMRGFESGKDFAANLRDTLVNMFKTLVLRPIIQPIAQSAAGAVLGAIGLGAPGSAAAAGGNLFSLGSSALNFSGVAGGAIGSVLSGLGGFGAGIAEALMGSSFVGPTSAALGVSGAGLGGMLGTAMPWIGGALALASILGAFGKGGGPKSGGETHYLVNASGTRDLGEAAILGNYTPADANVQMSGVGAKLAQQIRDTVLALGGSISKDLLVYLGYDTDPQGTAGNRVTSALAVNGQQVYRVQDRGVADVAAGVGEESKRLLVAALQATDISPEIDAIFDRVGNISTAAVSALDGALAEAQRIVDARIAAIAAGVQAVADAYQRERDAKLRAAAEWRQLAGSVAGTLSALGLGQLSALSPEQQLAAAQGAYGSLATRARLGDQSAIAGIGSAAQDYLTAARAYFASGGEYASIFAEVTGTLSQVEGVATRRADILDQQAALMTEQVAGIRLLAEQGATLNQAIDALAAEQAAGNRANEAGITALITELRALNTRMAALETAAVLAQAA